MDLGLQGKVVLITGATRGIAADIALGFAEESAQVVICARTKADLDAKAKEIGQATGAKVIGIPVDLSQRGEPERLIGEVVKALGRLDVLVNSAGVAPGGTVEQLSDDDWDRGIQLKLMGLVRCTRAAIPVMRRQGGGRIVNVVGNDGVKCAYWEIVPAICCAAERPLRAHRPEPGAQCRRGREGPCGQHPAQARADRRAAGGHERRALPRLRPVQFRQRRGNQHRRGADEAGLGPACV